MHSSKAMPLFIAGSEKKYPSGGRVSYRGEDNSESIEKYIKSLISRQQAGFRFRSSSTNHIDIGTVPGVKNFRFTSFSSITRMLLVA